MDCSSPLPPRCRLAGSGYGHQGRLEEAARLGKELVREIQSHWRGHPDAKPSDYMEWIVWSSLRERAADRERLRAGLRVAGLPA